MIQVKLIVVNDLKEKWLSEFIDKYSKKINYYCKFQIQVLKPVKHTRSDQKEKKIKETQHLFKHISKDDYVIVCDERGEKLTSLELAHKIQEFTDYPTHKRIVIVIGGAYGIDYAEIQTASISLKLKLSDFVMNHHIALMVLMEQVYRSFTINNNIPYHNE